MLQIFHVNSLLKQGKHPFGWVKTGSQACHKMTDMIGAASVAALDYEPVNAACWERGKVLQRLANERQIGVARRTPGRRSEREQTCLRQHPPHHGVVDPQVDGYSADAPFLDLIVVQYLKFEFGGLGHEVPLELPITRGTGNGSAGVLVAGHPLTPRLGQISA